MLQMYDFLTSMASCNATTWLVYCLRLVNTNLHGGTPRCCSSGPWCPGGYLGTCANGRGPGNMREKRYGISCTN